MRADLHLLYSEAFSHRLMVRLVLCPLLCAVRFYGSLQLGRDVARCRCPCTAHSPRRRTACQRGKMLSILYYAGLIHSVQLLPLDYAVYFSGTLFYRTVNRTQSVRGNKLCPARLSQTRAHQKLLWQGHHPFQCLFTARRRHGGSFASADTLRTALYRV